MPPRQLLLTVLAALLLPAAAPAQSVDDVTAALVRIVGTRDGDPFQGSGFVVALSGDTATVVTAAHVIAGADFEVIFTRSTARYPSGDVLGLEPGPDLAVFEVRGPLPGGVRALTLDTAQRPRLTEFLLMAGFPGVSQQPAFRQGILSTRRGTRLVVDQTPDEGLSGGPLLSGGRVVGVVTSGEATSTLAVNAVIVREFLLGSRVRLGAEPPPVEIATPPPRSPPPPTRRQQATPPPPEPEACSFGTAEPDPASGIEFVRLCGGTFTMGSEGQDAYDNEKPTRRVTLDELWIGRTEVTNAQFRKYRPEHQGADDQPVTDVTWHDAQAFCEHFGHTLPTEAQWEYAARAGSPDRWTFGDDESQLGDYAWYNENSNDDVQPVARKKANRWDLFDMHGNVLEWVADWYASSYPVGAVRNPTGPPSGSFRVLRGGSFADRARRLRSADR